MTSTPDGAMLEEYAGRPPEATVRPDDESQRASGASMADAPKVLVVDDTEGNRYAVARLLRGAGMQVSEAATGGAALRPLEACHVRPSVDIGALNRFPLVVRRRGA